MLLIRVASGSWEIPHSAHHARALSVGPGPARPVAVRLSAASPPADRRHAVAEQPAEDLCGGAGGDGIGDLAEPGADELGPDVAGLHLEPARGGILLDLALPVGDPVARLAERGQEPQVQP